MGCEIDGEIEVVQPLQQRALRQRTLLIHDTDADEPDLVRTYISELTAQQRLTETCRSSSASRGAICAIRWTDPAMQLHDWDADRFPHHKARGSRNFADEL